MSSQPTFPPIDRVIGVDFSGAAKAGRNIWLTSLLLRKRGRPAVESIRNLGELCGSELREQALPALAQMIREADRTLFAIDFPFGLPVELFSKRDGWVEQLRSLGRWQQGAAELGRHYVESAQELGREMHIRRDTDKASKTPFDCYHYRIIYQTFHGMRDVLLPLQKAPHVAVLPFQYGKLADARSVLMEGCPSSTLKRMKLPHQIYKQPAGGPLALKRRKVRAVLMNALRQEVEMDERAARICARNPGGDALDSLIAAVGGAYAWQNEDHARIAADRRATREGYVYF